MYYFRVRGIRFYTDYSGIECPKFGWEEFVQALQQVYDSYPEPVEEELWCSLATVVPSRASSS